MVTVAGEEFSFISPNADTLCQLVKSFLDGLRRRSKWGIGLQSFRMAGKSTNIRSQKVVVMPIAIDLKSNSLSQDFSS